MERQEIGLRSIVIPQDRHKDATWTAHIRLSFRGETVDIPTNVMVQRTQLNGDYEIIDESIMDRMSLLISDLRRKTDGINTDEVSDIRELLFLMVSEDKASITGEMEKDKNKKS